MDIYLIFKLVHVVAAVLWVGGATSLSLVFFIVNARADDKATLATLGNMAHLGPHLFLPAGLVTLLSGGLLVWMSWTWEAWVVLGLAIVAVTFVLGAAVLGPTSERAVKTWTETGDEAGAMALARKAMRFVRFDLAAQFAIVSLMVLKPAGWTDPLLAVPAALLALGMATLLRPPAPRPAAQPA